jgi:amino acid transporter
MAIIVGFTNALPMQVGVARILFAMGRDRQLPAVLARLHPRHGTPHVAMLVSTLLSLAVALLMRDHIDTLASLVNFGALSAFVLLHLSVLVHWRRRAEQRRWFAHVAVPVLGVAVVGAVLYGMHSVALQAGATWLVIGLLYGVWLRRQQRAELTV